MDTPHAAAADTRDFWERLQSINAGMLDAHEGARSVPMSHYADQPGHCLWFITAYGTDVADAASVAPVEATYVVADGGKGLYSYLKGTLTLCNDRARLAELWNPMADVWFEGGQDDPDVALLCFRIGAAEAWLTPTSGVAFMFNVAKAKVTGTPPDMGRHIKL